LHRFSELFVLIHSEHSKQAERRRVAYRLKDL